jgi:hypothetical protein
LQASFVFENVRYTLEIAGFSQGTNPYGRFWSEPQHATSRPHILTHTCTLAVSQAIACSPFATSAHVNRTPAELTCMRGSSPSVIPLYALPPHGGVVSFILLSARSHICELGACVGVRTQ